MGFVTCSVLENYGRFGILYPYHHPYLRPTIIPTIRCFEI